jgi:hypothetical protein
MMKLILGRLVPMALAGGLLTSALSPLKPALQAFGVAADALSGNTDAGGSPDLGRGLAVPGMQSAEPVAAPHVDSRRRLEDLAANLNGNAPKLKTFNAEPPRPARTRRRSPRAPLPIRPRSAVRFPPVHPELVEGPSCPWIVEGPMNRDWANCF